MFAHLIERYITSEVDSIGKSCKSLKPCVEQLFNFFVFFLISGSENLLLNPAKIGGLMGW